MSNTPAQADRREPSRPEAPSRAEPRAVGRLNVRTGALQTRYANVVTTNANRDEVVIRFGVKDPVVTEDGVQVRLHTRIAMNPQAAKRLLQRLDRLFPAPQAPPPDGG